MILRVGVGDTCPKQKGYLNIDIRPLPNIDVVTDAKNLPFEDEEHDGIESRNLVEHFSRFEIDALFKEWARVLKPGGYMQIETIDMGDLMDHWREIPIEHWMDGMLGAQTYPENFHKYAFTVDIMRHKLEGVGMKDIRFTSFDHRQIPRMVVRAIKA
jgi:predicted SAM-dependent methyltransferase